MPRLLLERPDDPAGHSLELVEGNLLIGRDAECGLPLADSLASRHHARLSRTAEGWVVEDLGSRNGTWVGDEPVSRRLLADGDRIRIGNTVLVFEEAVQGFEGAALVPEGTAIPAPRTPRSRHHRLALAAGCLVLAFGGLVAAVGGLAIALAAPSGRWDLLPSMVVSLRHGWSGRLNPARPPASTTAALDLHPTRAFRLSAPAGALDRPRRFEVRALGRPELERMVAASGNTVYAPVAAVDVDGGLKEGEALPGELRLAFRPGELGIPESLWPHLRIVHVDPEKKLHPLRTRREGDEVVSEVRHNSAFALALVAIVGLEVLYVVDQASKGALGDWHEDEVDSFRFYWPRSLAARDTPEHRALNEALARKWEEYRQRDVLTDGDTPVWTARLRLYLQDPVVEAAYARFHDPEWKKRHYYPAKVAHMVDAFQKAGRYLFDVRGFRRRCEAIEVYGLAPWTYPNTDVYAYTKDGHFSYPYVHVNLDRVPDAWPAARADVERADDLNTTAVHELFHVVQKEYFNWTKYANPTQVWSGGRFVWFAEATALVLEEEAKDHYLREGWNQLRFPLTYDESRFIGLLKLPLDAEGADETEAGHKGYAASRFLLALRERYYGSNGNAFLPTVLDSFSGFRMGPVDALVKATSQSEAVLGADYLLYASSKAFPIYNNTPAPLEAVLGRQRPLVRWEYTGPLSSPGFTLRWRGLAAEDQKAAKLVVRTHRSIDDGVYNRWGWMRGAATDWHTITTPYLATPLSAASVVNASAASIVLQRVETYTSEPSRLGQMAAMVSSRRHETTGLLLLPPTAPPKLRLDREKRTLHIELPPSTLWNEGELKEYRVKFHGAAGGKPMVVGLRDKTTADIQLDQLLAAQEGEHSGLLDPALQALKYLELQDLKDLLAISDWLAQRSGQGTPMSVSYYEVAKGDPEAAEDEGIDGPESAVFKVPVEAVALGGTDFEIGGDWSGQIMIAHIPATLKISGPGGTLAYGSQIVPFERQWDADQKADCLKLMVREGGRVSPSGITVYLRRLPGGRLWLSAPPIVFYRPDVKQEPPTGGFFGWLTGAGR